MKNILKNSAEKMDYKSTHGFFRIEFILCSELKPAKPLSLLNNACTYASKCRTPKRLPVDELFMESFFRLAGKRKMCL